MIDKIWIEKQCGQIIYATFGQYAESLKRNHEPRLRELWDSGRKQKKINEIFNQSGLNTHFVVDQDGNVLAAGDESHCVPYLRPTTVLVQRIIP